MAILRGRNGDSNRVRTEDKGIHDWYRFVLSYPPHLVQDYLTAFNLGPGAHVVDPFGGTGTTPVECKRLGIASSAIEANPVARFACAVKLDWGIDVDGFWEHSQEIAQRTDAQLAADGVPDYAEFPLLMTPARTAVGPLRDLTPEQWEILSRDWISPLPLHKTLTLLDAIRFGPEQPWTKHQILALAGALPLEIGNLRFGPEVGVGDIKLDAPVVQAWLDRCHKMEADLRALPTTLKEIDSHVYEGDARGELPLPAESADGVITSPPYPNEKEYTRTTRLESVILGFLHNKRDLKALKATMLRSNTRGVYKADTDDAQVLDVPIVQEIANEIEHRRIELGKTSGFEKLYARVTRLYFGGMRRHLVSMSRVLRPGAPCAYVVGDQASYFRVMIRTGQIVAEIAERVGYRVERIDLFRERFSTVSQDWLREEVVVLRWPGP